MIVASEISWMKQALVLAEQGAVLGEVPIGAVVVHQGQIISSAHNEVEVQQVASAHAEILALERASKALGRWRLDDCSLVVTLEPCSMCIGAAVLSRVKRVVFGAYDERQGAVGSLFNLAEFPAIPHHPEVVPEVLAEESRALLQRFFKELRG